MLSSTSTKPLTMPISRISRQTVLGAFQQVEDAMAATRGLSQQILAQQEAVKAAQQFLDLEMQRYQSGVDPFVDVVTAQNTLLGDQVTIKHASCAGDVVFGATGSGARWRLGPFAAFYARKGGRKDDQCRLHDAAVGTSW